MGVGRVLPYKGTCRQPGCVLRDLRLKHGIDFIIFCLKQGIEFINVCFKQGIFSWTINSLRVLNVLRANDIYYVLSVKSSS